MVEVQVAASEEDAEKEEVEFCLEVEVSSVLRTVEEVSWRLLVYAASRASGRVRSTNSD